MNDPLNRLRAYMDFYSQNQPNVNPQGGFGMNGMGYNANRLQWAQQMLQREGQDQQQPDYFNFADERQQQQQPQAVSPFRDPQAVMQQLQQPQQMGQPPMRNRLLAYMGGR